VPAKKPAAIKMPITIKIVSKNSKRKGINNLLASEKKTERLNLNCLSIIAFLNTPNIPPKEYIIRKKAEARYDITITNIRIAKPRYFEKNLDGFSNIPSSKSLVCEISMPSETIVIAIGTPIRKKNPIKLMSSTVI